MIATGHDEEEATAVISKAVQAFRSWRGSSQDLRARLLRMAAKVLHENREELIGIAQEETGHQLPRLVGELRRTCV